ncbi:toxin [Ralstonia solanacearum]|uniref:toxin n=1 Tax=Ralstonia solanacearum TaxID=305 RepID=UPI001E2A3FED|nr:toxin [Ralstonia solanacearum]
MPREHDLSHDEYNVLQQELLAQPDAGDVIKGTGGLRKLRFSDKRRGKGKRGGLRVIYYHWDGGSQFWMFVVYDKDEAIDLSSDERKVLARLLEQEVKARSER